MKVYEVKKGINVVDRGMRILGVYKGGAGRVFVNELPLIISSTTFPVKSLHWTRWYSTDDEVNASYRFFLHPILKKGDTIRSEDNFILIVEYTNELPGDEFPLVVQGSFSSDSDGKINFEISPSINENVAWQFFLGQFFIIPENFVEVHYEKIEFDGSSTKGYALYSGLDMFMPIYLITRNLYLGASFKFRVRGNTVPQQNFYYILELIRVPTMLIDRMFERELSERIFPNIFLARFNV